jgi:IS605 OrfB family transposase
VIIQTFSYRIKDSSGVAWLEQASGAVNYVWNYCNNTAFNAIKRDGKWLSSFDLHNLTSGTSKELKISSTSIQVVCEEYANKRNKAKKIKLRYRGKKSLPWLPFKGAAIKVISDDTIKYCGKTINYWNSRKLPGKIKTGSFGRDARGRWYVNLVCEVEQYQPAPEGTSVGIDLGLKTLATTSHGKKYKNGKFYQKHQRKLALAQKDKKRKAVKAIHAKIKNSRLDACHKLTTEIAKNYQDIFVGDVSSKKLTKTKMAKSVNDSGWGMIKTFLKYKAIRHSGNYTEVSEHLTTQTCSYCLTVGGPRGLEGLGIREWVCSTCNRHHDRDTNAAINILRLGHQTLDLK